MWRGFLDEALSLTGDSSSGQSIYSDSCAAYHGDDGPGGTGPSLVEEVPEHDDELLLDVILNGTDEMDTRSHVAGSRRCAGPFARIVRGV